MLIYPMIIDSTTTQVLSSSVKKEIARRVAEKVYLELRSGNYLEDAFINKAAQEIAKQAFDIEIIHDHNTPMWMFKGKIK